jgi:hypothetical protein
MSPADQEPLNGWKQIAAYLGRGVRTLQRWEREFGLPVHRPHGRRSAVVAIPSELDEWLRRSPVLGISPAPKAPKPERIRRSRQRS